MEDLYSWRELFARIITGTLSLAALALLLSLLVSPLATGMPPHFEKALWGALVSQGFAVFLSFVPLLLSVAVFSFLVHGLTLGMRFVPRMACGATMLVAVIAAEWTLHPEIIARVKALAFLNEWLRSSSVSEGVFFRVAPWLPLGFAGAALLAQGVLAIRFLIAQQELLAHHRRGNVLRALELEAKRFSLGLVTLVWSLFSFAALCLLLQPRVPRSGLPRAGERHRVHVVVFEGLTESRFRDSAFLSRTKKELASGWRTWKLWGGSSETLPRWTEYLTGQSVARWGIAVDGMNRLPARWEKESVFASGKGETKALLAGDWTASFLTRFPFGFDDVAVPAATFDDVLYSVLADNLSVAGTLSRVYHFGRDSVPFRREDAEGVLSRVRAQLAAFPDSPLVSVALFSQMSHERDAATLDAALARHFRQLSQMGWMKNARVVVVGDARGYDGPGLLALDDATPEVRGQGFLRGVDVASVLAGLMGNRHFSASSGSDGLLSSSPDPGAPQYWEGFPPGSPPQDLVVDDSDRRRLVASPGHVLAAFKVRKWIRWRNGEPQVLVVPANGVDERTAGSEPFLEMARFLGRNGVTLVETQTRQRVFVEAEVR